MQILGVLPPSTSTSIIPLPPPLLVPVQQRQELVHVVEQLEELVDESHGHSGSSVIKV